MPKITIVGAGLSGMVAGINLARQGYEVEIWEGGKSIGSMEEMHPSVHATPIEPEKVSKYIDIDITPGFTPGKKFMLFLKDHSYDLDPGEMHLVERGNRKTSLDNHLYNICLEHGIKFYFNNLISSLNDVPEGAIVATGLNKKGMDAIGLPSMLGCGCYARKKLDNPRFDAACMGWTADYTTDYGYLSVANDLMFYVVFNRGELTEEHIEMNKKHLYETEGLEFPKWTYIESYIPLLDKNSLQVFKNNRILTGSICGMIDPAALYGIHGALMSGKIAAWAVTDKEKALKEFEILNKNYQRVRILSNYLRKIPMRLPLLNFAFTYPSLMTPVMKKIDDGIPGYDKHWAAHSMKSRIKLEKAG